MSNNISSTYVEELSKQRTKDFEALNKAKEVEKLLFKKGHKSMTDGKVTVLVNPGNFKERKQQGFKFVNK